MVRKILKALMVKVALGAGLKMMVFYGEDDGPADEKRLVKVRIMTEMMAFMTMMMMSCR